MKHSTLWTFVVIALFAWSPSTWAAKKKKTLPPASAAVEEGIPAAEVKAKQTESVLYVETLPPKHHWYGYVQAGAVAAVQGSGGNSFSGQVSWNPTYFFTPNWAARGNLGLSVFKGTGRFLVAEYEVLGAYSGFSRFVLEAGAGAQTWFGNGGTSFIASGNGAWKFKTPIARFIDRTYLGYTVCFFSSDLTHQLKAGIGVAF